jgi:DNA-binding NarL/FixJ family response regulator
MKPIRVVLADDHPVVLAGIKALLQDTTDIAVVGEADSGSVALELITKLKPDIAVLDISLPDLSGVELARRLAQHCPSVKVLALTVHEDRAYLQSLLKSGARGYLLKRSAADELPRALRAVAGDGTYLDPAIAEKALSSTAARAGGGSASEELSPREAEVLRYMAQGFSNKEVAFKLDVSVKTVETHKARACEKLALRSRAEIVRYGVAQGWLSTDGTAEPPPKSEA